MERILLKAATAETAQEQGVFEAVISSAAVDREGDIVDPAGMVRALKKWEPTGKNLPLTWHHSTKPQDIYGYIDPSTARVVGDKVVVSGWVDQNTDVGKHAWRLVKSRSLGFSFGYLTLDGKPREGGKGRHITELDVFEVTATPVPMNADTGVLGWKAMPVDDLRERADAVAREADDATIPTDLPAESVESVEPEPEAPPEPKPVPSAKSQRRRARALQREEASRRRRGEERQLPDIEVELDSVPEPVPEPERSEAPKTEPQWRRATEYEREQTAARRRAEEAELPDLGPEPLQERVERRAASALPDPAEQRRKAAELAQEQVRTRRQAEEAALPDVPPSTSPAPPRSPRRRSLPDIQDQWVKAVELEREQVSQQRQREDAKLPEILAEEPVDSPAPPAPPAAPDLATQRRKAAAVERWVEELGRREEEARLPKLEEKMTKEPFSTSKTSNWVARAGGLPAYIQHIAHDLMEQRGMDESRAIQMAIGICQRWARGGGNVSAKTRAEAASAIAEWEALKAKNRAKRSSPGKAIDSEPPDAEDLEAFLHELPLEELVGLFEALYSATSETSAPPVADQREKAVRYEREAISELEDSLTASRIADVVGLEDDEVREIIERSEISPDVKGRLGAVLDGQQLAGETAADKAQAADLLRARANAVELEHASGGESKRKPPQEEKVAPPRRPSLPLEELKRKARDEIIVALSGIDDI